MTSRAPPLRRQQLFAGQEMDEKPPGRLESASAPREFSSRSSSVTVISSSKSGTIKKIQSLLTKRKKRQELGQTVVEGPRMVFDLLDNTVTSSLVRHVLVSIDDYEDSTKQRLDYRTRLLTYNQNNVLVQLVEPDIFRLCSDTVTPQGIVAVVDIPDYNQQFTTSDDGPALTWSSAYPLYLVLDGVSDPGNLGTLLRSALAVGVKGVVLLPDCCDVWNPKAVRSAMGASFQLPIIQANSWQEGLAILQRNGVRNIYVATMMEYDDRENNYGNTKGEHGSAPCFHVDWLLESSALVIGSEGNGLSPSVRQALIETKSAEDHDGITIKATHIPMHAGIESLNAAVCGSVILFEYSRQCQMRQGSVPSMKGNVVF